MTKADERPNILFLVWDACRLDYAREYASNLMELSESGLWFENAIAPATWSLPSHASLFTGEPPHKHGVTQPSQSRVPTDLVDELSSDGYSCYGVSGNGFASPLWGFDEAFDHFRSTRGPEPYTEGLDVYSNLRNELNEGASKSSVASTYVRKAITHSRPVKSFANLTAVGLNHIAREVVSPLQTLPHPVFQANIEGTYAPEKNTTAISDYIQRGSEGDNPFFVFSNYMDTHRPYNPPDDLQRKHLGERLDDEEVQRLNDEVAAPWEFIRADENDDINDDDVETLQNLYAGEVESADRHLGLLLDKLRQNEVLEDTLVIVTSDHGENLGEMDRHGNRRFGHEASLSDALCRVPLVIAHPQLEPREITEHFSLTDIFNVITEASRTDATLTSAEIASHHSARVACEYPALGDEAFYEEHPEIDREVAKQRVSSDAVAGYENEWRILLASHGTRLAEHHDAVADVTDAPISLVEFSETILEELGNLNQVDVDTETQDQLQDLGYL